MKPLIYLLLITLAGCAPVFKPAMKGHDIADAIEGCERAGLEHQLVYGVRDAYVIAVWCK